MLLLLALACARTPAEVPPSDPDAAMGQTVVVVIGCTLRADRIHAYGAEREVTPYVDRLGVQGARFDHVVSNAPWTRPGIAALTTGRHPLTLGVDDQGDDVDYDHGIAPQVVTLAERFEAAGWATIGATANPNANARFGFAQGFDAYLDTSSKWRKGIVKAEGADVVDAWLEEASQVEGPLYGQLVLVDTHRPVDSLRWRRLRLGITPVMGDLADRYDAALNLVDEAIERLDGGLAAQGRSDRLLVFVGDHGEGLDLPKHAGRAHANWLYDPNLRVPWIVHGPGVVPGTVIDGLAQSVDVVPTLLAHTGLAAVGALDGADLDPLLRQGGRASGVEAVLSVTRYGRAHKVRLTTPEWVYIRNYDHGRRKARGRKELYRADDAWQDDQVSQEFPDEQMELDNRLEVMRAALEAGALSWEAPATSEDIEQLRALGYVDD